MTGSPVDAMRFWELAAALSSLLLAWLVPGAWIKFAAPLVRWFRFVAQKRALAICIVGLLAFCGDGLVSWRKPPVPTSFDEFSYLLAADTFAQGRVTNPTPAMSEFFETPEVLVRPSYQSKYPPGQALFLAFGQRLAGSPLVGIWLSSALACAAICWMLQAWTTASWALYGGLLAALRFAFFGAWAQSYWGGMVAALGGALLYGALRRIVDENRNQVRNAVCFALGIILLANTRPFEGLLATIPALIVFLVWLFRSRQLLVSRMRTTAFPSAILLLIAGGTMLQYNRRITGNAWTLPYVAYEKQYDAVPSFAFQQLGPIPAFDNAAMEASAQDTLWTWRWQHGSGRLVFITAKLLEFWQFLFGAAFSAALVLLVWSENHSVTLRVLQTAIFLLIQSLATLRFLFWPTPSVMWIVLLFVALIIQFGALFAIFRGKWERLAVASLLLIAGGITLETWRFHSHYVGPIAALAIVLVINSLRRSQARTFALLLPLLIIGTAFAESSRPAGMLDQWAQRRFKMQKQLEALPGKQLVFVYYRPSHDLYEEWVQNRADLDQAAVVWALSRSAEENCKLVKFFPGRKIWSLDADRGVLQPYSTDCASPAGPDELVPNQ
jgi:hypothetical protein